MKSEKTLYICGGGASSVYTAGMLKELEARNMIKDFEYIVGASSGAFSACFVVSGTAESGAAGYWKMLPYFYKDKKFVSIWKLFRFQAIMNVRYLISYGLTYENPIPWQKVLDSKWNQKGKLIVQVMDADTGRPVFCSNFKTVESLQDTVAASCCIPFLAAIWPYRMKLSTLENIKIVTHKGECLKKKKLRCFDGDTCDMYAYHARKIITSKFDLVLTTAYPDHSNKCYPFTKLLAPIEFILGWIIFFPNFMAIWGYQRERIFGAGYRQFKKLQLLSQNNPEQLVLVTVPKEINFKSSDVLDSHKMEKAVQVGQDIMSRYLQ